jgi:hypothetical protein
MNTDHANRGFLRRHRVEALLFLACWISFACVLHLKAGWNVNSRLALTFAVVDHGSFAIDAYHDKPLTGTLDKAFFRGHYYSDKSPALSLLAVPVYALVKPLLADSDAETRVVVARQWCTAWTVGLLGALAAVLFHRLMLLFGAEGPEALALTLFLFFGTNLGGYTSLFFAYLPATCCLLGAYVLGLSARSELHGAIGRWRALAIGFLISTAGFLEFTYCLAGVVLLALTFATMEPRRHFGWVLLGCIPPVIALFAYNATIFGELTLAYSYEAASHFRSGMSQGFMGITRPDLAALYFATIHPFKGIFFYSPVLLFFFVGAASIDRLPGRWRADLVAAWIALIGYLAFVSSYFMWWGGWSMGVRHLIAALPLLFLPILAAMRRGPHMRAAVMAAGGVALALNLPVILSDPQIPSGYSDAYLSQLTFSSHPRSLWLTQAIPDFLQGRIAVILPLAKLPGHWPLLPLALLWAAVLPAAWHWSKAGPRR